MSDERSVVAYTSDALCVLRSSPEAGRFGVRDAYAAWFVTEAGTRVFELARAVDPTFVAYNLARYVETTRVLAEAARRGQQIVVLGAGTDCRALTMPELAESSVFLVDQPAMSAFRGEVLAVHGVEPSERVKSVPFDLAESGLPRALRDAGWREQAPTLVLAEGVLLYLPSAAALSILDPGWLPAKSALWCDAWTAARVARLNAAVLPVLSRPLFHALDLAVVSGLGYRALSIVPLERICAALGARVPDLEPDSWVTISAST
jgi:methyltransferase (TIGR00027 family)